MKRLNSTILVTTLVVLTLTSCSKSTQNNDFGKEEFEIVNYNNPNALVDLGVGLWAWPLPMDYDNDGDMDLLVSCPDKPYNGTYFFENVTGNKEPVFAAPVRLTGSLNDVQISYIDHQPRILIPGAELVNFKQTLDKDTSMLFPVEEILSLFKKKPRFNQWKMIDYDNDEDIDIIVGVDDWSDYGWDNAFDSAGNWINGPLHGYVYLIKNENGQYVNTGRIEANGKPIDVYGAPSPNFADFDGDGDLDLICGEFLDKLTWFENSGTREEPMYAEARILENKEGPIKMDLEMIVPVAVDFDGDGHVDLVVGDEDGRVAYIKNEGKVVNNMPIFTSPVYFKQKAGNVKFGALITPFSVDWDNDQDEDIITGNSAGYIAFIENLGGYPPKWAPPKRLQSDGEVIRLQAGENGSIQGPAEAKWGYTTLSVADWDGDGLKDIIINSIWGKIRWYKNIGTKKNAILATSRPIRIDWEGKTSKQPKWNWWKPEGDELVTQWRTTPYAIDWNEDGLMDLIMLDHEGYLAYFKRFEKDGELLLSHGSRIFYCENGSEFNSNNTLVDTAAGFLRLNANPAGSSGRRKFSITDWNNDGKMDILVNSQNVAVFENVSESEGVVKLKYMGNVSDKVLAGHTTSPTTVDWDKNGIADLLVGAEDGHLYFLQNPLVYVQKNRKQ